MREKQEGAVLIISLIMLLVLTLIGVSGMQSTAVQERMTSNLRDTNSAFQAAESAIKAAEAYIESVVTTGAFNGTSGLYGESDSEPAYTTTWSDSNSVAYSGAISGVASAPRYRIKIIGEFGESGGSINIGRYGEMKAEPPTTAFRITARGTGASDTAVVFLQSHYGRKISN